MKKKILRIACIIFIVIILGITIYFFYNRPVTLSQITNIDFGQISYVTLSYEDGNKYEEFVQTYQNVKFKKKNLSNYGSTASRTYTVYDKENNFLFEVVELGNRNLILVQINGEKQLYQQVEK